MIVETQNLSPELQTLKQELLTEIKNLLTKHNPNENKKWLRSSEVREVLGISPSTLYNLKIQKILMPSKINGTFYYSYEEVMGLLNKNKQ